MILKLLFQIHIPLVQGRPGANEISPELLEFTKARYVRFRFMGLRGNQEPLPHWLTQDIWRDKKLFYSIRDINIGGHCLCNGHAENCRHNVASGVSKIFSICTPELPCYLFWVLLFLKIHTISCIVFVNF